MRALSELERISGALSDADTRHGGSKHRLLKLARHCPTRWLGILKTLLALIADAPAIFEAVKGLAKGGWTPTTGASTVSNSSPADAENGADDEDVANGNADAGNTAGGMEEDELSDNDRWPGANRKMRCALLHRAWGVAKANFGRVMWLYDVLRHYEAPVLIGQTATKPISHRIARALGEFTGGVKKPFVDPSPGDEDEGSVVPCT